MTDVDVEALKRAYAESDEPGTRDWDMFNGFVWEQWPAIIAALEDRERLRAAVARWVEQHPGMAEADCDVCRGLRAALEGPDD